jgi:hypothetical protein
MASGNRFIVPGGRTISLSNGTLVLRYRSEGQGVDARISFKRAKEDPLPPPTIPTEILVRFDPTEEKEETIEIVLPAASVLKGIKEVSLSFMEQLPPGLSIVSFEFIPFDCALDPVKWSPTGRSPWHLWCGVTRRSSSPPSSRLRRTPAFLHGLETVASCEGG